MRLVESRLVVKENPAASSPRPSTGQSAARSSTTRTGKNSETIATPVTISPAPNSNQAPVEAIDDRAIGATTNPSAYGSAATSKSVTVRSRYPAPQPSQPPRGQCLGCLGRESLRRADQTGQLLLDPDRPSNRFQGQFAQELGMRQPTISEWETGVYAPKRSSSKLLTLIAEQAGFEYGS